MAYLGALVSMFDALIYGIVEARSFCEYYRCSRDVLEALDMAFEYLVNAKYELERIVKANSDVT